MELEEQLEEVGMRSISQLAEVCPVPARTLRDWVKKKPDYFQMVIDYAAAKMDIRRFFTFHCPNCKQSCDVRINKHGIEK